MENRKIRVAITHGDTNGIGYELIFKTFAEQDMLDLCTPIIYGSPKIAAYHNNVLDMKSNFIIINNANDAREGKLNILPCFDDEVKVEIGVPTEESGQAAVKALDKAMSDCRDGMFDVLVSAPVEKQNIKVESFPFNGLTKYINTCIGENNEVETLYVNDKMCVALLTDDVALKNVASEVTKENIITKATLLNKTLKRDFRISCPRIAILSLNPNADGQEEKDQIKPAIESLVENSIQVYGPFSADDFFATSKYESFDGVLAMYHDQGVLPFKALQLENGVTVVAGLDIVCTAPDDDPSFEIAGKGISDESALRHAIYTAIDIFRNRENYDEPMANPLQKLYKDRREDGDRSRFSRIPRTPDSNE